MNGTDWNTVASQPLDRSELNAEIGRIIRSTYFPFKSPTRGVECYGMSIAEAAFCVGAESAYDDTCRACRKACRKAS